MKGSVPVELGVARVLITRWRGYAVEEAGENPEVKAVPLLGVRPAWGNMLLEFGVEFWLGFLG